MMKQPDGISSWISAAEASRTLGVTRPTLYAYVSRGLVRSEPGTSSTRERRYAREDIERLKRRADEVLKQGRLEPASGNDPVVVGRVRQLESELSALHSIVLQKAVLQKQKESR